MCNAPISMSVTHQKKKRMKNGHNYSVFVFVLSVSVWARASPEASPSRSGDGLCRSSAHLVWLSLLPVPCRPCARSGCPTPVRSAWLFLFWSLRGFFFRLRPAPRPLPLPAVGRYIGAHGLPHCPWVPCSGLRPCAPDYEMMPANARGYAPHLVQPQTPTTTPLGARAQNP